MKELLKRVREFVWLEGDPEKDHSTGLAVFGALEVLLGVFAFLMALLLVGLIAIAGPGDMKSSHLVMTLGVLLLQGFWFVTMGVGSIRARRWARALMLVGSWVAIFFGTVFLALLLYVMPGVYGLLADADVFSPEFAMWIMSVGVFFVICFQLVMPMAAIAFYSLKGVQATCERLNPESNWTDRHPLPLLAMGLISVMGCLTVVLGAFTNYVVLLFGSVQSGTIGFWISFLVSVACGYVGWGAFTRRMHAWWLAYALVLLTSASMMLTFSELDMDALFAAMGYSAARIERLGRFDFLNPAAMTFITCVWGILTCIYLVWARDCFIPVRQVAEVKSYQQRMAEQEKLCLPKRLGPRMRLGD
ncbi:MAG: hypothetical protein JXR25_13010 [Pontiellaceae bacterium]|nr:hypothetical protein [Pontiellaceae bacterium]MBN2785735.1 hypothetical protein [Pontiellaceae bacterium]